MTKEIIDRIKSIKMAFMADVMESEKALTRKSCKDPSWHRLRIQCRTKDVYAMDVAINALNGFHGPVAVMGVNPYGGDIIPFWSLKYNLKDGDRLYLRKAGDEANG